MHKQQQIKPSSRRFNEEERRVRKMDINSLSNQRYTHYLIPPKNTKNHIFTQNKTQKHILLKKRKAHLWKEGRLFLRLSSGLWLPSEFLLLLESSGILFCAILSNMSSARTESTTKPPRPKAKPTVSSYPWKKTNMRGCTCHPITKKPWQ